MIPAVTLVLHEEPLSLQLLRQALENYQHQCRSLAVDCEARAKANVRTAPVNGTLALERRASVYGHRAAVLLQLIEQLPESTPGPPAPLGFPGES